MTWAKNASLVELEVKKSEDKKDNSED